MVLQCGNLAPIEYFLSWLLHFSTIMYDSFYSRLNNHGGTLSTRYTSCIEYAVSQVCMISECTQYSIGFSTAFCVLMKTLRNQASKLYQEVIQIMLAHLFLYHWLYRDNHCNQHLRHDEAHCKLDKHPPSSITTKNSIALSW